MDKSCKLMDEWSKRYYKTLYIFARRICRRPSDVENVVYQTLILAYKNRRKLKRAEIGTGMEELDAAGRSVLFAEGNL